MQYLSSEGPMQLYLKSYRCFVGLISMQILGIQFQQETQRSLLASEGHLKRRHEGGPQDRSSAVKQTGLPG